MHTYSVERLPGEPIVISTAFPEWRAVTDMDPFVEEFMECIESCPAPVHYIADLTEWHPDLQDILVAANKAARSANAILHHPNVEEFVLVTPLSIVEIAGKGLRSTTFGSVNIAIFHSLGEALAYVRGSYLEATG